VAVLALITAAGLTWMGLRVPTSPWRTLGDPGAVSVLGPALEATDTPPADNAPPSAAGAGPALQLRVMAPARLVRDQPVLLEVELVDAEGSYLDPETLVEIRLQTELVPAAVGWLTLEPREAAGPAGALTPMRIELHGFGLLPCASTTGTVEVRARELVEGGHTASTTVDLPGIPCEVGEPPPAAASVHETGVVCRDEDWVGLEDRLIDNEVLYHPECNPEPSGPPATSPWSPAASSAESAPIVPPPPPSPTPPDPDPDPVPDPDPDADRPPSTGSDGTSGPPGSGTDPAAGSDPAPDEPAEPADGSEGTPRRPPGRDRDGGDG
jgi:hypothetical protein